jgi:osmotically-inducible protein OsmY
MNTRKSLRPAALGAALILAGASSLHAEEEGVALDPLERERREQIERLDRQNGRPALLLDDNREQSAASARPVEPRVGAAESESESRDRDRAEMERRDRELAERAGPVRAVEAGPEGEPRVGAARREADTDTDRAAEPRDADNTARNERDRDRRNLDPLDQGNSRDDIQLTARIRSALVANDHISTNAKNVKIITRGGQVTLRGPVNSPEEKRIIEDLAQEAAPGRVTSQLEVTAR